MGSSSSSSDYDAPSESPAPSGVLTPTPQQPAPSPWVRYPSFLPSDPSAMATGLTQPQVNAIDRYTQPAYMTPTEVEGGIQTRAPTTTPAVTATAAPATAQSRLITESDLGTLSRLKGGITGQGRALVGQEANTANRAKLADLVRRAQWQQRH